MSRLQRELEQEARDARRAQETTAGFEGALVYDDSIAQIHTIVSSVSSAPVLSNMTDARNVMFHGSQVFRPVKFKIRDTVAAEGWSVVGRDHNPTWRDQRVLGIVDRHGERTIEIVTNPSPGIWMSSRNSSVYAVTEMVTVIAWKFLPEIPKGI